MFTLLVLSEPCRFFQHPYHFHRCSDYLTEGTRTGKFLVRHGWNLVRTGCLDCKFYPSRTLFWGTRAIFTRAVPKTFFSKCIPGFQLSPISFLHKHLTHSMYRGLWACAMACANLNGTRCLFDLFLQKSSISFSDYSPQNHTNANRSYSRVFVQGDESARGIAFQQRWVVSERALTHFLWKALPSTLKFLEQRILRYSSVSILDCPAEPFVLVAASKIIFSSMK